MKKILAAIDFSDSMNEVIEMTKKMARVFDAEVLVLHTEAPKSVVHYYFGMSGPFYMRDFSGEALEKGHHTMEIIQHKLSDARIKARCVMLEGPTVESIVYEAENFQADLIIAGAGKHGALYDFFVGDTSYKLIKAAPCPILVVPHQEVAAQKGQVSA